MPKDVTSSQYDHRKASEGKEKSEKGEKPEKLTTFKCPACGVTIAAEPAEEAGDEHKALKK
jgi:predicted RNA-binding Zn-ribbon protein involved in translation (DUF1610 family)